MKTTITLEGEKKIREMLEQALMLESVQSYASSMADFYWTKAMDILSALSQEFSREEAFHKIYLKYNETLIDLPSDHYVVTSALEKYEKAHNFASTFEWHVNRMVKDLTENPITVECADDEDPDDVAEAWLEIDTKVWERFTPSLARLTGSLQEESAGFEDKYHDYDEMLKLHLN